MQTVALGLVAGILLIVVFYLVTSVYEVNGRKHRRSADAAKAILVGRKPRAAWSWLLNECSASSSRRIQLV